MVSSPNGQLFEDQVVQVGKFKIHYVKVVAGAANGKAVLLLPGAIAIPQLDFKPQLEALPEMLKGYTIIFWDPPGYGKSSPPKKFHLDYYREDAEVAHKMMETLGYTSYSLLGWCDGGKTAMTLAGLYPMAVEKLVIWGCGAYLTEREIVVFESIRDIHTWSEESKEPKFALYGKKDAAQIWTDWTDTQQAIYKERQGDICKGLLQNIVCPTFILHGAIDHLLQSDEHCLYLQKNIKNTEFFVFPEGKHNIHLTWAEDFNNVVVKFLLK